MFVIPSKNPAWGKETQNIGKTNKLDATDNDVQTVSRAQRYRGWGSIFIKNQVQTMLHNQDKLEIDHAHAWTLRKCIMLKISQIQL